VAVVVVDVVLVDVVVDVVLPASVWVVAVVDVVV
jgi:hypothetical protein